MPYPESLETVLGEYDLKPDEFLAIAGSAAFGHLVDGFRAKQAEAVANGRPGSVTRVVQQVEVCSTPYRDEGGPYVAVSCVVCATKYKVRQLKRGAGSAKKPTAEQLILTESGAG